MPKVLDVVVRARILLVDEDPLRLTVPDSCPAFVCPAEAEWKIRFTRLEDGLEGAIQDSAPASEPIVVVAERLDAMVAGQVSLGLANFRDSQVVKA